MSAPATFHEASMDDPSTYRAHRTGKSVWSLDALRTLVLVITCTPAARGGRGEPWPISTDADVEQLDYEGGGLAQETNWWGAFVIGLAGTILVTGIAPVMVTSLGAASIPLIVVITIMGYLLCLLLAELSAMMPERTGGVAVLRLSGVPGDSGRARAKHVNGITAWMYWLGWFPVAPLNMILASFYLADRFGLDTTSGFTPINTLDRLVDARHLRRRHPRCSSSRPTSASAIGAGFATVLGIISMIPLTFLAVALALHRRRRLGPAVGLPRSSTAPASSPASTATAGSRSTWATRSC